MNPILLIVICVAFIVSVVTSLIVMKMKNHKYIALAVSSAITAFILVSATPIVYSLDNGIFQNQSIPFFINLGIYNLIYFIPVIVLINYVLIHVMNAKKNPKSEQHNHENN
ncbi:hypothetical protein [Alkalihalobacillus pseudalcaliphilus]|uniref:hypothetical protein n=1 Tax=Alkalihalobacillus pseudalcaliphilus TaxID=79884 RepID=UPI00064D8230|nr:hypothetical protein [Alkalihalobacillus pseudalcaliphilus]KMK76203.1 hypothetical protein AB990_13380 [Alkalihalobacillus pseudalcaliphilus]